VAIINPSNRNMMTIVAIIYLWARRETDLPGIIKINNITTMLEHSIINRYKLVQEASSNFEEESRHLHA